MKKFKIDCAVLLSQLPKHREIKDRLLLQIKESKAVSGDSVSRSDWPYSSEVDREWVDTFLSNSAQHIEEMYAYMGYKFKNISNIWFQQYENNSGHDWHVHGSVNFAMVYYLELPNKSEPTQIISPYDQKNILDINAKEGDIVIFPSFAVHQAPRNNSKDRRTVIAFNVNVDFVQNKLSLGVR